MRWPLIAVLVAGSCTRAATPAPAPTHATDDTAAHEPAPGPAVAAPPPPVALPHLTQQGLGALTGDTLFDVDAIRQALPALAWAWVTGANNPHIVGALDGTPIVFVRGDRFVETIWVASPRIASELGIEIGQPAPALASMIQSQQCMGGDGPLQSGKIVDRECWIGAVNTVLGGAPDSTLLADRHVIGLQIRVAPGPVTAEAAANRPPRLALDPAVARSPLVIDRTGIHPITDMRTITLDTLGQALPGFEVTSGTKSFVVSHGGARVLEVTLSAGKLVRVEAFHPSIRTKLGIAIDQTLHENKNAVDQLELSCRSDPTRLAATCALSRSPRIDLQLAAAVKLPAGFSGLGVFDDPWLTSIVWTPPRAPVTWPTIEADHVGGLTPAIAASNDPVLTRTAFPDFDLTGDIGSDFVYIHGLVGAKQVFEFVLGGITLLDPRFRLAGIGVGSTAREAEAAGLTLIDCYAADLPDHLFPDPQDHCNVQGMPRVTLEFGRSRLHGQAVTPAQLASRRITRILWRADPPSR